MTITKIITDYEIVDLGIDHSDYFQGFGTSFTDFTDCCYGIGNDPREALDDCLENASQMIDIDWSAMESRIKADYPDFYNAELVAKSAVDVSGDEENDDYPYYHIGMRWNS